NFDRLRVGISAPADGDFASQTGDRPGFEQIFDYVDVGPVWFDSQRWFDPETVQFRLDSAFNSGTPFQVSLHRMFNRSVETLQPPYNYIGRHRTPGKINLNTSPDYIRKGPGLPVSTIVRPNTLHELFLDDPRGLGNRGIEDPENPASLPTSVTQISFNPSNDAVRGDGLSRQFTSGSALFGNGSVYRSLAWGHSTLYELDNGYGSPSTLGENNRYFESVDTSFGRGFKGFVESRRGYGTSASGVLTGGRNAFYLGNAELDFRYPTRFAGMFAPAAASSLNSVQRFMRQLTPQAVGGFPRRTHDMGLLRPHPDFDLRTLNNSQLSAVELDTDESFSLDVEVDPTTSRLNNDVDSPPPPGLASTLLPALNNGVAPDVDLSTVDDLRMPLLNTGLFERPQAELHMNRRGLDRDSYFKHRHAARLAGMTTHHSNVFMVRMTMGYFYVDPETNAVGQEFISDTGQPRRSHAVHIIDRTIPVGFLRGKVMNTEDAILYAEIEE
ncbi:MAG: hypothetical protein AAGJ83_07845, partial [Planctomycetota bacterium]